MEEAPEIGIGRGVDVDGEGRQRLGRDGLERVALDRGVGFRVFGPRRGGLRISAPAPAVAADGGGPSRAGATGQLARRQAFHDDGRDGIRSDVELRHGVRGGCGGEILDFRGSRHVHFHVGRDNIHEFRQFLGRFEIRDHFIELGSRLIHGHLAFFVEFGEEVAVERTGNAPEGAAEHKCHDGGNGGEACNPTPGEPHGAKRAMGRRLQNALALFDGEGDFGFVLQLRFKAGGQSADFVHGGLLGGVGPELRFDLLAFGGREFAEGVGGQFDFIDGVHGGSPRIGRLAGAGFGCRRG